MNDFSKEVCMLCNNGELQFFHKLRDDSTHFVTECCSCGHVQVSPLPTIEEEIEYYQKNEMSRRLIPKNQINDEKLMMKYEIWGDEQCKIISSKISNPKITILEVGSGFRKFN
jgi:hypothetical protein